MTVLELIDAGAKQLTDAQVAFGHGTLNAFDEAAWLVLWRLGLPIDSPLEGEGSVGGQVVTQADQALVAALLKERIQTRQPAAYLTREAWLQGVPFYVDERAIVPRSLIAELLADGSIDAWLAESTHHVLDLCTGNGSLAVIAAMVFPDTVVTGSDLSSDALAVARINVDKHQMAQRITLLQADGLTGAQLQARGPFDLILCNPPYVSAQSMAALPLEFQAEPQLALDGNTLGSVDGMDFIRALLAAAPEHMSEQAVLLLEIGNERAFFEKAFPDLDPIWMQTSAGQDQVLLLTRDALLDALTLSSTEETRLGDAPTQFRQVTSPHDWDTFKALLEEYAHNDLANPCHSSIWQDIEDLPGRYHASQGGAAVLIYQGGELAGCGALAATAQLGLVEIKRIYVRAACRRQGLARAVTLDLLQWAKKLGYQHAGISTWPDNTQALPLYLSLGFTPIAAFKDYPHGTLTYLGLSL